MQGSKRIKTSNESQIVIMLDQIIMYTSEETTLEYNPILYHYNKPYGEKIQTCLITFVHSEISVCTVVAIYNVSNLLFVGPGQLT